MCSFDPGILSRLTVTNELQLRELRTIVEFADGRRLTEEWVTR